MLCGIDEAGRGPIAGDLVMAGCVLHHEVDGLNDSKKLTPKKREELYEKIVQNSSYHIVKFSAATIDEIGISKCLTQGLLEIMQNIKAQRYLFDGNSSFGVKNLETLIKADATIPQVSAASILAKVAHDRDMLILDKLYPQYKFASHKGYGTALHVEMIKQHGYSDVHRKSYKIKALEPTLF
ncbi:ribonuclease HII [bacterium]|nr:ribonuclease HII [bacterium]MBU1884236.1 ribonuclease HII [bacterium]